MNWEVILSGFLRVLDFITSKLAPYGHMILLALVILFIGRYLAKFVASITSKAMRRARVEANLVTFTRSMIYVLIIIFTVISALQVLGFSIASFVAVFGAASLAIGLALRGSLSNLAAGILMIIFKPFKVGDFVESGSICGTVVEIQILNTIIDSPDNVRNVVPNSQLTGSNLRNYSANGSRRIDLLMTISAADKLDLCCELISELLAADSRILREPAAMVAVSELGDNSFNLVVRPWVSADDYWHVRFDIMRLIKNKLDSEGVPVRVAQKDSQLH